METKELQQPFFAQFMVAQGNQQEDTSVTSWVKDMDETHKFPSDGDEDFRG